MKIFCHIPRENWIVDRMGKEYKQNSSHEISFNSIDEKTDLIWLFASWCWNQIPQEILAMKKVLCTIHHEVPEKFDKKRRHSFIQRDKFVDYYHTYTNETANLIKSLTNKPVRIIPHWVNDKIWISKDKNECRKLLDLPEDKYLIGSFQRDTEGSDLESPKLEKGPDIFVEKVRDICRFKNNVHVVLAGWRRQYVIKRLKELNIDYTYTELPSQQEINDLYNTLDLYIVSSRCEGGPQAIFEASYLNIPIISTKVGQSFLLSEKCIYDRNDIITEQRISLSLEGTGYNFYNIKKLKIENHIKTYDDFVESI